ncbi:MAG: hypothetical protein ABFC63_10435 [Thermoguttaceae bacterium]
MADLLLIIVRWLADRRLGGTSTRRPWEAVPVGTADWPRSTGYRLADASGVFGWMTMRLEPVPCVSAATASVALRRACATTDSFPPQGWGPSRMACH